MIQRELRYLMAAMIFFTRIPGIVLDGESSQEAFRHASKYFPLIGWIVGVVSAGAYWGGQLIFSPALAILLSITAAILVTGALHEDGFADFCDGFGAGWTKEQILAIMKDSYTGVFGVIGLIVMLGLRLLSLLSIPALLLPMTMISGHSLSRFAAISLMATHEYARDDASSKAKAVVGRMMLGETVLAGFFGLLPFFTLALLTRQWTMFGVSLFVVWLTREAFARYCARWIGGYTGDCLGAAQQITELMLYLTIVATI